MSTSPVMTVTDELLAELEELAFECNQHGGNWYEPRHMAAFPEYSCDQDFVVSASPATITALTAELRRLRAENAELAKDAGRYRWLRDESLSCGKIAPAIMVVDEAGNPVYRGNPWNSLLCDDDADSAIDTAMADQ